MIDIKELFTRIYNKIYVPWYKKRMGSCGDNVYFSPFDSVFSYENLYVGNNVCIGYHADFISTRRKIIINDHVIFGPNVSIRGGNHPDIAHRAFSSMKLKIVTTSRYDADVIFKGYNLIGMNSIIPKGVTIGRGCIVAAGAVVTKSTLPYSIVGGAPARILKMRFTQEQIEKHEIKLYK